MRHKDRQPRLGDDVPGCAPEYHLPEAALSERAFDQKITSKARRLRQYGFPSPPRPGLRGQPLTYNPIQLEMAGHLTTRRPWDVSALDRQDDRPARAFENGHREGDRPRCLGAGG